MAIFESNKRLELWTRDIRKTPGTGRQIKSSADRAMGHQWKKMMGESPSPESTHYNEPDGEFVHEGFGDCREAWEDEK